MKSERATLPLLFITVCAVSVLGCLFLYQHDNKYNAPRLDVSSGAVNISEQILADDPVLMLVDGWEVYGGRLLSPQDFSTANPPRPDAVVFIGQYGGFENLTPDGSPHGSVTYRLLLNFPDIPQYYTLALPEIFSAYRAYVDGTLVIQIGDPDPEGYRPETLITTIVFEANGITEIVIAVSDFSHFYSGMIHPPALGLPEAMSRHLSARFLFRALLCAVALTIGLLSVLIGIFSRRVRPALVYGLLCLFFVIYAAYPVTKTFYSGHYLFYALESVAFCAMLVTSGVLLHGVSGIKGRAALVYPVFGGLVCAVSVTIHIMLASLNWNINLVTVMYNYSLLITGYIWVTAAYFTVISIRAVLKRAVNSKPILAGIIIFDTALIMDRVLPMYEPILTGWFHEWASFALILCIGIAVGTEIAQQYKNSAVLSERAQNMEQLLQTQRSYYLVLDEKMEDTRALRHDLRHHISVLDGLLARKKYTELETYLSGFKQDINTAATNDYSKNRVVNVLANHYEHLASRQGVRFDLRCGLGGEIPIPDADFSALLCNLLENALEAGGRLESGDRFIRAGISRMGSTIHIRVTNSAGAGLTHLADGRFASSKAAGRTGYGLYSVRMITAKYGGLSETIWDEEGCTFTHSVTLFTP